MKKKFDLFGLKAYDEKVDNEDKDMNLQDQFYSQGVKYMKERRKLDKRADIYLIFILIGLLAFVLVGVLCSYFAPVEVQANAAEATTEETEINYYNYTLTFNKAPCHFFVPNSSYVATNYPLIDIFKGNYLFSDYDDTGYEYMTMLYEVLDPNGVPFAREVLQVGFVGYRYIGSNYRPAMNFNNVVVTNNLLSSNTTVTSILGYQTNGDRLFKPTNIQWDPIDRFKVKISIPVGNDLSLANYKIRACSLVDYYSYPNNSRIWMNYNITQEADSDSVFNLGLVDASRTDTADPTYSIAQSYDSYFNDGYNQGYTKGYRDGEVVAQPGIYDDAYNTGYDNGYRLGQSNGYIQGVEEANDYSFLSLTTAVVDAPVKIFSSMFDFNVLGFNMTTFLFSIITICLVLAVVKRLL